MTRRTLLKTHKNMNTYLQSQIQELRDKVHFRHLEAVRCKQAYDIAERLHADECERLSDLLKLAAKQRTASNEYNAFPNGRWT
jgi:hypothetical protein